MYSTVHQFIQNYAVSSFTGTQTGTIATTEQVSSRFVLQKLISYRFFCKNYSRIPIKYQKVINSYKKCSEEVKYKEKLTTFTLKYLKNHSRQLRSRVGRKETNVNIRISAVLLVTFVQLVDLSKLHHV